MVFPYMGCKKHGPKRFFEDHFWAKINEKSVKNA
jgi:hypothetical protein